MNLKIELIVLINSESYVSGTANKIRPISLVHIYIAFLMIKLVQYDELLLR